MSRKKRSSLDPTYCRAYLVTLGLALTVLAGGLCWGMDAGAGAAGGWTVVLVAGMGTAGIALLLAGLLGPSERMEAWADSASRHEASLLVLVLAYPVYLVLALFYGTGRSGR